MGFLAEREAGVGGFIDEQRLDVKIALGHFGQGVRMGGTTVETAMLSMAGASSENMASRLRMRIPHSSAV